ncbi:TonB-dependent receptor [Stakelama sp. CBK3Z-3]|uniref:TonB-dependent receptor n=1 Tax=Stakelama flava TaxID=2860338 RepID=A0ABS6XNE5_9SPHN|nr:TonB-dependent receptor [Stakelama flava]MBW4330960.1 TonB-dependent receptor [Stakelama flava]
MTYSTNIMRKRLRGGSALHALALFGAGFSAIAGFASPAAAQNAVDSTAQDGQSDDNSQEQLPELDEDSFIVVTGTRISNPNVVSQVPITSVDVQALQGNDVTLGDTLNQLPSLRSTYSQSNSTQFIGTSGLNLLDLRGIGTTRTLTLVNGRRVVTSVPGEESVDTNTIPPELVERVDIITGGSSAVYGSDAVAGVVNFILKDDYEGVSANAQGGVSSRGDRGTYSINVLTGTNLLDDRLNITVGAGYAKAEALYFTDRDSQYGGYSGRNQFNSTQSTLGESSEGDGIPDRSFLTGVRNNNISNGGLITSSCPVAVDATDPDYDLIQSVRAQNCTGLFSQTGNPATGAGELGRTYVFDSTGALIPNPITTDLRPYGSSNSIGGLGSTLNETSQLVPSYERANASLNLNYKASEAAHFFFQGTYVDIKSVQSGQPTFFYNTFNINNPFLTSENEALLRSIYGAGPDEDFNFGAFRFNTDFGGRGERHDRKTYNLVGGIEGKFNDDWQYSVAVSYGHTKTYYQTAGNVYLDKYYNSIDAVRNDAGQIVCGINADSDPSNDDPACVPINLFGEGVARTQQAALDYFTVDSERREKATLFDVTAYVSGDSSQIFELPGGPISFSIGGEYRRETAFSAYDDLTKSGVTFLNAFDDFDPPSLEVKEAFGELSVPLLADIPFVQELTLNAAGRVSDYNVGKTGTVFAWNLGGTWSPIRDLRFRMGYAKSVRAPSLADLYSAAAQDYALITDPCGQENINNNPNRVANCAADGVPTTVVDPASGDTLPFTNVPGSSIVGISSGNPNLEAETGYSFTIGGVYQPHFIPGLSISVDYYNIRLDNVIYTLDAQTLIDQCYDSPSGINNQYCAAVFRNADGTFAGQSDRVINGTTYVLNPTGNSFQEGGFNFARQQTTGIDFDVLYNYTFDTGIKISAHGILGYVIKKDNYTDVDDPTYIDRQLSELGDPVYSATFIGNVDFGRLDINYTMRYVGRQTVGDYETQHSWQGRPATNPDAYPVVYYPDVTYHDVRVGFDVMDAFRFYVGVDNIFDKDPPYGLSGTSDSAIYDNIGRSFYAGVRLKL